MLFNAHYAQNYASMIGASLVLAPEVPPKTQPLSETYTVWYLLPQLLPGPH